MDLVNVIRILDRNRAIEALVKLREEWQEAAGNIPLSEVNTPVRLLLADVVSALELLPEEAESILGSEGFTEPYPIVLHNYAEID
jgi:hypothetical protein